jgi:hypothetical protein
MDRKNNFTFYRDLFIYLDIYIYQQQNQFDKNISNQIDSTEC